jgi:thiosulfate dehydrogenase (quinone) large subunit
MSNTRKAAAVVGGLATVLLLLLLWPIFIEGDELLTGDIRTWATWIFWILAIVLIVLLFQERNTAGADQVEIEGPAFARFLFGNRRAGLLWLPIRLFLGVSWLEAGYHKFTDPAWTGGGEALKGYWERAVAIPEEGRPLISFEWYRDFLNFLLSIDASPWFAWIITFGEMAVGLGLIIGLLTGVAAFFGVTMNMSFLLAGSASTNPVMAMLALLVILAWKVAGYYGLDRWVLPILGTPWRPGKTAVAPAAPQPTTT